MSNTSRSTPYDDFLAKRKMLDDLIQRQLAVLESLDMTAWKDNITQLSKRMRADSFKVLVMGEFNRGKSTFINALLGQKVLPAFAIPTTAIINEVKWGEGPRAVLHFLPTSNDSTKMPMEVPVDQIGEYVVIKQCKPGLGSNQQVVYENPYEKVELFWPLNLCRDGVEIIDSPGLNEDVDRQKITINYLTSIDVAIYLVACDFPLARSEMLVIETIKSTGHEYIFFICNRINMIDLEEQDLVKERCVNLLAPFTKGGKDYIFFINARGALEGRLNGNTQQVQQSNILQVEDKLKTFLATERGRIKLLRPATELRASIREASRTLPERQQLLHTDLKTIQARYASIQGELNQLEREREQISTRMTNFRVEIRIRVQEKTSHFYRSIADRIEEWTSAYEVKYPFKIYEVFSQDARERVVEEVTKYLTDEVSQECKAWQASILGPFLDEQLNSLAQELDEKIRKFTDDLEQMRHNLVSDIPVAISSSEAANQDNVSTLERILATAGGFLIGDIATAALGGMFGFREMFKSLVPQLAIAIVTVALVGWNPFILVPALVLGGGVQALIKANAINKKIRDTVGKEYARKLLESHADMAHSIANSVDEELKIIQDALHRGLGLEIQNVLDQVDSIIKEKQQGQARVDAEIAKLAATFDELNAIDSEIDALIQQVILAKSEV